MDMINLREAPIVDKAEEGATLFALNPDGTINRISAENVGGSGGGVPHFIRFNLALNTTEEENAQIAVRTASQNTRPHAPIEDILGASKARAGDGNEDTDTYYTITCDTDVSTIINWLELGDPLVALMEMGEATSVYYGYNAVTEQCLSVCTYLSGDYADGEAHPYFAFDYFDTHWEVFWNGAEWEAQYNG